MFISFHPKNILHIPRKKERRVECEGRWSSSALGVMSMEKWTVWEVLWSCCCFSPFMAGYFSFIDHESRPKNSDLMISGFTCPWENGSGYESIIQAWWDTKSKKRAWVGLSCFVRAKSKHWFCVFNISPTLEDRVKAWHGSWSRKNEIPLSYLECTSYSW